MNTQAAVFRKVQEPLTVESVEIDKPSGREVLVRTAATGVCHSDLHVVDGSAAFRSIARSCWATRAPASSSRWAPT